MVGDHHLFLWDTEGLNNIGLAGFRDRNDLICPLSRTGQDVPHPCHHFRPEGLRCPQIAQVMNRDHRFGEEARREIVYRTVVQIYLAHKQLGWEVTRRPDPPWDMEDTRP